MHAEGAAGGRATLRIEGDGRDPRDLCRVGAGCVGDVLGERGKEGATGARMLSLRVGGHRADPRPTVHGVAGERDRLPVACSSCERGAPGDAPRDLVLPVRVHAPGERDRAVAALALDQDPRGRRRPERRRQHHVEAVVVCLEAELLEERERARAREIDARPYVSGRAVARVELADASLPAARHDLVDQGATEA